MSEIFIREATIADVADIQRLARLLARFEFESGLAQDIDPQWAFTEAGVSHIRRQLAGEDSITLVATCDGEVVGFLDDMMLNPLSLGAGPDRAKGRPG